MSTGSLHSVFIQYGHASNVAYGNLVLILQYLHHSRERGKEDLPYLLSNTNSRVPEYRVEYSFGVLRTYEVQVLTVDFSYHAWYS
jgi:hypothetical protein